MSTSRTIYLDNASTTPLDPRVFSAMMPYLKNNFGNPGSIHALGVSAKCALLEARKMVARTFSALPDEIIFTSGGTESNNLAITGLVKRLMIHDSRFKKGEIHAITSVMEHSSVLEVFRHLEKRGLSVTYLPVDENGIVDLKLLKKSLRPETVLVSVMYANNEIGTIQPIREIAKIIRHFRKNHKSHGNLALPFFHIDASQAPLYLDMHVDRLGADLVTIDGQKIYGPKGIGALFVRRGVQLEPIIFGGGQESGVRSGTENVPAIVGFAKALEIGILERNMEVTRLSTLRDYAIKDLLDIFPTAVLNGHPELRLPGNINISIPETDTEFLTLQLDAKGIAVSTKSSCMRDSDDSYVIKSLGGKGWRSVNSLRISLGRLTQKSDINRLIEVLKKSLKVASKKY